MSLESVIPSGIGKAPKTNLVRSHLGSTKNNQVVVTKDWTMEGKSSMFNGTALVWDNGRVPT